MTFSGNVLNTSKKKKRQTEQKKEQKTKMLEINKRDLTTHRFKGEISNTWRTFLSVPPICQLYSCRGSDELPPKLL